MTPGKFTEPNYKCKVIGADEEEYVWLTYANSEDELCTRLEGHEYEILEISDYDFSEWKKKAVAATQGVIDDFNNGKKLEFISKLWNVLKLHLFELFANKCAYCEAKVLHVASGDVEHYRPKKKVTENSHHPGYYWLAYDVSNYLPTCEKCNRVRGKRNHFPVKNDVYAYSQEDIKNEVPLLLNPYDHVPDEHLFFTPGKDDTYFGTVEGRTEEGITSVKCYNLKRAMLTEKRREEQESVENELLRAMTKGDSAKFTHIWKEMQEGRREFSAAALSHARSWWKQWNNTG